MWIWECDMEDGAMSTLAQEMKELRQCAKC